jgi:drug/metabolite transporter (DMT)-like permease
VRDRDHAQLPEGRDLFLLTLVIIGIGTSGPLIALSTMPIIALIFWRNLGGALLLSPFAIRNLNFRNVEERKGLLLSIASGVVLAGHFIGFFIAMRYTSVAAGTALTALQPIFAALFVKSLGGRISRQTWGGMSISFIGVLIVTGVDFQISTRAFLGDLAAIACAALAAAYVILGASARESVSTATYAFACYLTCAIVALAFSLISNTELIDYPKREWLLLLALIAGAQILGHTIMNFTLRKISPAIVSLVVFFEVPVSALLAFWWLNQLPTNGTVPGLILILFGCYIFVARSESRSASNR